MATPNQLSGLRPGYTPGVNGRPRGWRGVAKRIMAESGNAEEFIEWAFSVWRDPQVPMPDRRWAFEWLTTRALGHPVSSLDINITDDRPARDLSVLTDEAMDRIDTIFRNALATKDANPPALPSPKKPPSIIDLISSTDNVTEE